MLSQILRQKTVLAVLHQNVVKLGDSKIRDFSLRLRLLGDRQFRGGDSAPGFNHHITGRNVKNRFLKQQCCCFSMRLNPNQQEELSAYQEILTLVSPYS